VYHEVLKAYPQSFLLCDEVGLGKTIEAGLLLRQLVLSGWVRRALLLVPKSVHRQWMEELWEKFALVVPFYDGHRFTYLDGRVEAPESDGWSDRPLVLASSQLAKRAERQPELEAAADWDLILVDEAHHARRRDFLDRTQRRPNRLMTLLEALRPKTRSMLLLTATPMQVNPIEVWDLLRLLGLGDLWGSNPDRFVRFFGALRAAPREIVWRFVLPMVRAYVRSGGALDERQVALAEADLGPVRWHQLHGHLTGSLGSFDPSLLSDCQLARLTILCRKHTPVARYVQRNTRDLLRRHHALGILTESVPERNPKCVFIEMREEERELYDRLEEYFADYYQKLEQERKGLGSVMTVYRKRLTSSMYALRESLYREAGGTAPSGPQCADRGGRNTQKLTPCRKPYSLRVGYSSSIKRGTFRSLRYGPCWRRWVTVQLSSGVLYD